MARLVAGPDGRLQAFWWDRFDGITTAVSSVVDAVELTWSDPFRANIQSDTLDHTPTILADANGLVHAFWIEDRETTFIKPGSAAEKEISLPYLMHSRMAFGSSLWSYPDTIAEAVLAFDVAVSPSGTLSLGYLRQRNTEESPSGAYVRQYYGLDSGWSTPTAVYSTIYYRLLTLEQAWIDIEVATDEDGKDRQFLTWSDPYHKETLFSSSLDAGISWSNPEPIGNAEEQPERAWLASLSSDQNLLIWKSSAPGNCILYQEMFSAANPETLISPGALPPRRILDGLLECPDSDHIFKQSHQLIWLWGEGSSTLNMVGWDPGRGVWSQPYPLSLSFQDQALNEAVNLNDLHAVLAAGRLALVGADETSGEVWFSQAQAEAIDLVYAPPPPWNITGRLSPIDRSASLPAMIIDDQGRVHAIWSQGDTEDEPGDSLYYLRSYAGTATRPVEIIPTGAGEMARQPALLFEAGRSTVHLVWSGGEKGSIFYSRASLDEAVTADGWFPPISLSPAGAAWPQIGQDGRGRTYILYVLPLNEERGLYLLRSKEGGEGWSEAVQVFDGAASGWEMVDHPSLAVSLDGTIHAAWVQGSLPGFGSTSGIYYARSQDGGQTWTAPLILAGPGCDWPRLALSGGQVHLLYAGVAAENLGIIFQRWAPMAGQSEAGDGWSSAASIPGWKAVALPFALTTSGSQQTPPAALHLAAAERDEGIFQYAAWDGERWSAPDTVEDIGSIGDDLGVAAAAQLQGGVLAAARLVQPSEDTRLPGLYLMMRSIPEIEVLQPQASGRQTTATPTIQADLAPSITPTAAPTPVLSSAPARLGGSSLPLILGSGLAVLVVLGAFSAYWFFTRR